MNLIETYGSDVWRNATPDSLVREALSRCDAYGRKDDAVIRAQIETLAGIIARLIDAAPLTDQQKLDVVGLRDWELSE